MTAKTLVIDTDTFLSKKIAEALRDAGAQVIDLELTKHDKLDLGGLPEFKKELPESAAWMVSESPYRDGLDNSKRALIWRDEKTEAQLQVALALSGNGSKGDIDLCLWIEANTPSAIAWCAQYGGDAAQDVDECATLNANDVNWMVNMRGDWSLLQSRLQATLGVQPVAIAAFVYLLTGESL